MAFNWKDFATGFLEKTTETIEDKAAEAKQKRERQEALARQNASLIEQRRQRARTAATLGQQARALGATDEQLAVALNSGVAGVQTFYQNLQAAANQRGVQTLSSDDIDAIIDMPSIPPVDISYEDMVEQVYGARPTAVPTELSEPPLWASMLGLTAVQDVERDLATEQFASGLTVQQINDMAAASEYSQIPGMEGAYVNYFEDSFFTNEKALDFKQSIQKAINEVERSDPYRMFTNDLRLRVENGEMTPEEAGTETQEYVAEQSGLGLALEGMVATYKGSFLQNEVMSSFFESTVPASLMASLTEGFEDPAPVVEEKQEEQEDDLEATVVQEEDVVQEEAVEDTATKRVPKRPRPDRRGSSARSEWNKKYKGRFDPTTGEPIVVEPRPPEGTVITGTGRNKSKTDLYKKWIEKYGETHNPDGTPKQFETDSFVGEND